MSQHATLEYELTKAVFTACLRVRAVSTGQVFEEKEVRDCAFYLNRRQMKEVESTAANCGIARDDALIQSFGHYVNGLEYTQFSLERVKRKFPEVANLYLTVDVELIGKVKWMH